MNTKWIDDLFYFLNKDYGTSIQYTRIDKGNVNLDTGQRDDAKTVWQASAVLLPISIYSEFLSKLTGKTERAKTKFLVRKDQLPSVPMTTDYFNHANLRYVELEFDDLLTCWVVSGRATTSSTPYNVIQVSAIDQLGLNDGV